MFSRLINYLASQYITKALSNSPAFQRFAARTHQHVSSASDKVQAIRNGNARMPTITTIDRLKSFSKHFRNELRKNITDMNNKKH